MRGLQHVSADRWSGSTESNSRGAAQLRTCGALEDSNLATPCPFAANVPTTNRVNHLQQTASAAALLYTRATRPDLRETVGHLLRALTTADRAITAEPSNAVNDLRLVRELTLAAVGGRWLREDETGRDAAPRLATDLRTAAEDHGASFDRTCAATLRARFPSETAVPAA